MGWAVGSIQSYYPEKAKVQELSEELAQWKTTGQELPQHQNSYWRFEGPKLQKRVQDLEMELEYLRSKTLWRQD
jgi:hypothetical protein